MPLLVSPALSATTTFPLVLKTTEKTRKASRGQRFSNAGTSVSAGWMQSAPNSIRCTVCHGTDLGSPPQPSLNVMLSRSKALTRPAIRSEPKSTVSALPGNAAPKEDQSSRAKTARSNTGTNQGREVSARIPVSPLLCF
jgi:hypothetical protein